MPKISQLGTISQLTTSSVLPVVDNGATQKVTLEKVVEFVSASLETTFATDIELLRSASAITSSLNTFASASVLSVASKLSTASFEAYTSSVSFDTSSLLLSSSFNTFTSSYKTDSASFDSRVDNLELINVTPFLSSSTFNTFTSSYTTHSSSFDSRLDVVEGISVTPFLSASTFNTYTSSNESTNTTQNSRLSSLESNSGSYLLKSETGSFITEAETGSFLTSIPNGIISSSAQITAFGFISSSHTDITALNNFTTSINSRVDGLEAATGSYLTSLNGAISGSGQITSLGFATTSSVLNINTSSLATTGSNTFNGNQIISGGLYVTSIATISSSFELPSGSSLLILSGSNIYVDASGSITGSLSGSVFGIGDVSAFSASVNSRIANAGVITDVSMFLSQSVFNTFTTSSFNSYTASVNISTSSLNTFTSSINTTIKSKLNTEGVISGSSQILLSSGIYSSSAQLPSGLVSGSSQILNSSNILSSSVEGFTAFSSSVNSRIASVGGGATDVSMFLSQSVFNTLSSSIYTYTSSMNSYTASINSTTASLNGKTGSYATTGSNQFKADQTITGSLTVTALTTISSSISANSSSLYLTSGSNLYVQNNGLVEITGSLLVSGSNNINLVSPVLQIGTGSGDEGGEILLAKAVTNTTLTGSGVTVDVYRDRLRLFEQGGDARGVYIDLAKTPGGVAGELMWKASGIVNAGTFVTLDNIKAQVPTSGNRGLSLATVSGTVTGYISGHYQGILSSSSGTSSTTSLSTTATSSMFSWNFGQQGDMSTYILRDDTNNRVYRIILIIGSAYNNNFISIERLY